MAGALAPDTSRAAANSMHGKTDPQRLKVLRFLSNVFGATDEMIQDGTGLSESERPRRIELLDAGLITNTGMKWPTKSRREAMVWAITEKGVSYLESQNH